MLRSFRKPPILNFNRILPGEFYNFRTMGSKATMTPARRKAKCIGFLFGVRRGEGAGGGVQRIGRWFSGLSCCCRGANIREFSFLPKKTLLLRGENLEYFLEEKVGFTRGDSGRFRVTRSTGQTRNGQRASTEAHGSSRKLAGAKIGQCSTETAI